jgi:hypothetical protein
MRLFIFPVSPLPLLRKKNVVHVCVHWIENDGYLRVLAAMSETCRATWPLHLFFSLKFSTRMEKLFFLVGPNPKSKKGYWTCTVCVYIYIYWEENWFPFNRLFIPHNTEAAWDDFYTAHWSRAKCYVLYTIPRTSRGRERESFNLETDLSYRIR